MKRRRAFTLIELLVVVAIISILAAIAIPNYMEAINRADAAACKGNLRTLGTALAMYRLDWGEFPLADGTAGSDPSPGRTVVGKGPAAGGSWDGVPRILLEFQYLTDENALYCPALVRRHNRSKETLRYAYNSSARDTFGHQGGASHVEKERGDVWLLRCMWVPPEYSFHPKSGLMYPHGDYHDSWGRILHHEAENVLFRDMRVEERSGRQDFVEGFSVRR